MAKKQIMTELFQSVISWYLDNINYFTITVLMAVESSFIPFPSEIVIPPAAFKAAQGEMNIFLVVFFGSFGALIGALFNYYVAYFLGRKIMYKLASTRLAAMMLITPQGVEKAEQYFVKNGNISTFVGRLIPAIRQLISLPAGLSKMNLGKFILYTVLGSTVWNVILAILGYVFYSQKELLNEYYHDISIGFAVLGALFILFLVYKGVKGNKSVNV